MDDKQYYSTIRSDIASFFTDSLDKVLEVGCGFGRTLGFLKENGLAQQTFGIDINPDAIKYQEENAINEIRIGDIEKIDLDFPELFFDCILLLDIIEHLKEPNGFLRKIKKHLCKDGFLIISIPTVRNVKVIYNLLFKGDFKYEKEGILDKTHLRFFTKKTMIKLFDESGLKVETIEEKIDPHPVGSLLRAFKISIEFGVIQYVFKLKLK